MRSSHSANRSRGRAGFSVLVVSLLSTGCSQQPASQPPPAAAATAAQLDAASAHTVTGRGPAAINGQAAVVILQPTTPKDYPVSGDPPYMDQFSQTFIPPMLFVRTGQRTQFRNSDDVLHNVRVRESDTKEGMFNVAVPTGQVFNFTFPRDGFYDVGCDIHPGMSAQILSTSSPYVTVAASDGSFAFEDVEAGSYVVTAYAGAQKLEKKIEVAGARTDVGF
jgi:plastocyanin